MPEKMTKEEAIIAMAIKKARKAKSMLHESTQIMPYDHEVEVVKIKRPKAQNVKIKNQTQKKEGYGLAGETLKKEDRNYRKTLAGLQGSLTTLYEIIESDMKSSFFSKERTLKKYMGYLKEDLEDIERALRD